jgi:[acyl-carrier-protein] S-malonyltransferase
MSAVQRAVALAQSRGAKRAVMLTVSAPFHCALMAPAADAMREALGKVEVRAPVVPLVANVEAAPITEPDAIRGALVRQVTGTVRWRESVSRMAGDGITSFVEIGAGKVLTGLVRRIAPAAAALAVTKPDEVAEFRASFDI